MIVILPCPVNLNWTLRVEIRVLSAAASLFPGLAPNIGSWTPAEVRGEQARDAKMQTETVRKIL